jgi:hypothetical protein
MQIRTRTRKWLLGTYLILLGLWWLLSWTESSLAKPWHGPWKAQVVDAETRQPLEGAVVLFWWRRCYLGDAHCVGTYYDSEEVVTGSDGRFVLPFLTHFEGPERVIFKPGYGRWSFPRHPKAKLLEGLPLEEWRNQMHKHEAEIEQWNQEQWERFEGEGAVIELRPLKTKEDWQMRGDPTPGGVPSEKMPRFIEAIERERRTRQWR